MLSVHRGIVRVRDHGRVLHHGPEVQLPAPWELLLVDPCTRMESYGHGELTGTSNTDEPWRHGQDSEWTPLRMAGIRHVRKQGRWDAPAGCTSSLR